MLTDKESWNGGESFFHEIGHLRQGEPVPCFDGDFAGMGSEYFVENIIEGYGIQI